MVQIDLTWEMIGRRRAKRPVVIWEQLAPLSRTCCCSLVTHVTCCCLTISIKSVAIEISLLKGEGTGDREKCYVEINHKIWLVGLKQKRREDLSRNSKVLKVCGRQHRMGLPELYVKGWNHFGHTSSTARVNRLRFIPSDEWVHMVGAALILQMMERGLPPKWFNRLLVNLKGHWSACQSFFSILFRSSILVFALSQVFSARIKVFE